jgi:hypothetical protein
MLDAMARREAIAHAAECERCAARLAAERNLAAGLKALAATERASAAPDGMEARLLAEFRRAGAAAPPKTLSRSRSLQTNRWLWAAAAGLLLTLGFYAYRSIRTANPKTMKPDVTSIISGKSPGPIQSPSRPTAVNKSPTPDGSLVQHKATARRFRKASARGPKFLIRDEITIYATTLQYTSDFFMFDPGGNYPPMDQGQLIRVEFPRPALVRMGLPINAELADVPMKADLLVGEDGLARAIRFIR